MMETDDKKIIRECRNGNKQAFEMLIDKYQNIIFNVAYRMVGDRDNAEDITQTTFIKAYNKLDLYNAKYKFFSWLYRIVVNETFNFLKSGRRFNELDSKMISTEKNPEQKYLDNELGWQVQAALLELDPQYRILILLKHFQNCSYQEISESLNIPEKKVKSRLYSARQILKDILIRKGSV
jgi:RNA polymerase sigma-70 factor (ECF subfamily)